MPPKSYCISIWSTHSTIPGLMEDSTHLFSCFLLFLLLHWSHFQRGSCSHSCGWDNGWRPVIAFSKSLANANNRKWKNVVYNFTFSYCLPDRGINEQQNYQKASNVLIIYQLNKETLNKLHNLQLLFWKEVIKASWYSLLGIPEWGIC